MAYCIPQIELVMKIADIYPDKSARSLPGGSESVETAVKMAKKYQINTGKSGAYKDIKKIFYHGATAMAVSLGKLNPDTMGPEMPGAIMAKLGFIQYT